VIIYLNVSVGGMNLAVEFDCNRGLAYVPDSAVPLTCVYGLRLDLLGHLLSSFKLPAIGLRNTYIYGPISYFYRAEILPILRFTVRII